MANYTGRSVLFEASSLYKIASPLLSIDALATHISFVTSLIHS